MNNMVARPGGLRPSVRVHGFTLVETLVAIAVLAVAGAALASVQLGALRAQRNNRQLHMLATAVEQELLFQRLGPAPASGACQVGQLPPDRDCSVVVSCLGTASPCDLWSVRVQVTAPNGPALTARTVRYDLPGGTP